MGVELKLLPIDSETVLYSHQLITVRRDYDLFDKIREYESGRLEKPLSCYVARDSQGEISYGELTEDPYGDPLKWLYAEELAGCSLGGTAQAFVEALNPATRVVLYWH